MLHLWSKEYTTNQELSFIDSSEFGMLTASYVSSDFDIDHCVSS